MKLTEWEKTFLKYFYEKYNAKYIKVFNNKHPILNTKVTIYNVYKRRLKIQPTGELTFTNMFYEMNEGDWYFIPSLLYLWEGETIEENTSKEK